MGATGCVLSPGVRRSHRESEASPASPPRPGQAPRSDGELSAALCSASGQHLPAALGLHAGPEAVLLRAMSLLGLIRLLGHELTGGSSRASGRWWTGAPTRPDDPQGRC